MSGYRISDVKANRERDIQAVVEMLADGPMSQSAVMKRLGLSGGARWMFCEGALQLRGLAEKERRGGHTYWRLKAPR